MSNEPMERAKYTIPAEMMARLENDFTYHHAKDDQPQRYVHIRAQALGLAAVICSQTPPSFEQTEAVRKLQEVMFWANAAIARNE